MDDLVKTTDEMMSLSHGNLEAIMKSGQTWAAGFQTISRTMATAAAQVPSRPHHVHLEGAEQLSGRAPRHGAQFHGLISSPAGLPTPSCLSAVSSA